MDIDSQTHCLAQVIHHEARGEPIAGQEAVAQIVINRAKHPRYPKDICKVATQPSQFSRFHTRIKPNAQSYAVAVRVRFGNAINRVGKRLYFSGIGPAKALRIGNHKFW